MARKSVVERNKKRIKLVEKLDKKRQELKKMLKDPSLSLKEKFEIRLKKLDKLPRDSSKIRIKNRCSITGRARSYHRKFGVSRIILRDLAAQGMLPGVKKYSW